MQGGAAFAGVAGVGEEVTLINVEEEVGWVVGDDGGQDAFIGGDEVARVDLRLIDAAGDGGVNFGSVEIDTRGFLRCACLFECAGGGEESFAALINGALRDVAGLNQAFGAVKLFLREIKCRLGNADLSLRLTHGGFKLATRQTEKKVAFLNDLAVSEVHLLQIARNASAYLNISGGFETANELVIFYDGLNHRICDGNRRWTLLSDRKAAGGDHRKGENGR